VQGPRAAGLLAERYGSGDRPIQPAPATPLLQRLTGALREFGLFEGCLYLASGLLDRISRGRCRLVRYHIVAQPVPRPAPPPPNASLAVRLVAAGDPVTGQFPRERAVIARRFADGAECLVAESRGRFAGFLWIARRHYEEDEVRCRYELRDPGQCAWDFDVHVEPAFRLSRAFARLWEGANIHLAAGGVRWSLSRISAFNPGSLAAHRRLGIRRLASATFLVAGGLQLSLFSTAPFVHFGWSPHTRPILRLHPPAAS